MSLHITDFFDEATNTVSYLVVDSQSLQAAVIDSVLDLDYGSGRTSKTSVDKISELINEQNLELVWIIETHVHADHLSGAPELQRRHGGTIVIGDQISKVQTAFKDVFNLENLDTTGGDFGKLVADGETLPLGEYQFRAIHTPGHTPACTSYHIDNYLFVGDTIFMPDFGSARCDFPGGSADTLYDSVMRLFAFPDDTQMMICHDYMTADRKHYAWRTTVGEQKRKNIHLHDGVSKEAFVEMRTARDSKLGMPKLIVPSVQVNVRAGKLPDAESNGVSYLKVPLNLL